MKFSILGFSVVEDRVNFQEPFKKWAAANGHDVSVFGFGGFKFAHMPHLIDMVASEENLEGRLIFVDITSSGDRANFDLENVIYSTAVNEIFTRLALLKVRPVILHLFRRDIDYENDALVSFVDAFAAKYHVPVLNIGQIVNDAYRSGSITIDRILRDEVHLLPTGGEKYSEIIDCFLRKHVANIKVINNIPEFYPAWKTYSFAQLISSANVPKKSRHGIPLALVEIGEGDEISVTFEQPVNIASVFYEAGPAGGYLQVGVNNNPYLRRLGCFDGASYYKHLYFDHLNLSDVYRLTFRGLRDFPAVNLAKGSWDSGPRLSRLSHLCITGRSGDTPNTHHEAPYNKPAS